MSFQCRYFISINFLTTDIQNLILIMKRGLQAGIKENISKDIYFLKKLEIIVIIICIPTSFTVPAFCHCLWRARSKIMKIVHITRKNVFKTQMSRNVVQHLYIITNYYHRYRHTHNTWIPVNYFLICYYINTDHWKLIIHIHFLCIKSDLIAHKFARKYSNYVPVFRGLLNI